MRAQPGVVLGGVQHGGHPEHRRFDEQEGEDGADGDQQAGQSGGQGRRLAVVALSDQHAGDRAGADQETGRRDPLPQRDPNAAPPGVRIDQRHHGHQVERRQQDGGRHRPGGQRLVRPLGADRAALEQPADLDIDHAAQHQRSGGDQIRCAGSPGVGQVDSTRDSTTASGTTASIQIRTRSGAATNSLMAVTHFTASLSTGVSLGENTVNPEEARYPTSVPRPTAPIVALQVTVGAHTVTRLSDRRPARFGGPGWRITRAVATSRPGPQRSSRRSAHPAGGSRR